MLDQILLNRRYSCVPALTCINSLINSSSALTLSLTEMQSLVRFKPRLAAYAVHFRKQVCRRKKDLCVLQSDYLLHLVKFPYEAPILVHDRFQRLGRRMAERSDLSLIHISEPTRRTPIS